MHYKASSSHPEHHFEKIIKFTTPFQGAGAVKCYILELCTPIHTVGLLWIDSYLSFRMANSALKIWTQNSIIYVLKYFFSMFCLPNLVKNVQKGFGNV